MQAVPSIKTLPYLQLANWIFRPLNYIETNRRRHGDLFFAQWETLNWVFVHHPEALKQRFSQDTGEAVSAPRDANRILISLLGEHFIAWLDGVAHRQRRKLNHVAFSWRAVKGLCGHH